MARSYLPLRVHLQNVHHVDHDVLVRFLVLAHSEGDGEPAGATCTHMGLTALRPPLAHLKRVRICDVWRWTLDTQCLTDYFPFLHSLF